MLKGVNDPKVQVPPTSSTATPSIPYLPHIYPLPPPVSPLIYRVFDLSNRGDNATTEIFPGIFSIIRTIWSFLK